MKRIFDKGQRSEGDEESDKESEGLQTRKLGGH